MNVNCTWGDVLSVFLNSSSSLLINSNKSTRRDGSSCLPFTRWRGGKNYVHGRGNMSWGPTMVAPSLPLLPHDLSPSWLPGFSMQASPWECDVAQVCSSPLSCVIMYNYQSWLVSEGWVGGIWYFSSSSFLCALPVYCTLLYNTCSFMFKKILKVRKIFCIFDFKRHVISTF